MRATDGRREGLSEVWPIQAQSRVYRATIRRDGMTVWCRDCTKEFNAARYIQRKQVVTPDDTTKCCRRCGVLKPISHFPRNAANLDGHGSYCKACSNDRQRIAAQATPPRTARGVQRRLAAVGLRRCRLCGEAKSLTEFHAVVAGHTRRQSVCKPCASTRHKQYVVDMQSQLRGARVRKLYGLAAEDVDQLIVAQQNRCLICGRGFTRSRPADVDHCHSTGSVRGVICNPCNTGLGNFRDDPSLLRAARVYLLHYATRPAASAISRAPTYTLLQPKRGRVTHCLDCGASLPASRIRDQRRLCSRYTSLFKAFRLRSSEYDTMRAAQGNRCAICGTEGRLALDHDHVTDVIRAFLCDRCNIGIGSFGGDVMALDRAVMYVQGRLKPLGLPST